jgi:uncharacterized membrane protein
MMTEPENPRPPAGDTATLIQDVSAWVLRIGVILSVTVMLIGIVVSFIHGPLTVSEMQNYRFDYHPLHIWHGIRAGRGRHIIEAGVYLLVLTPVVRVAMSVVLFAAAERDWLYTAITLAVLILTLTGLLFLS